ncbi:MAG: methyltransferase [Bdellovibrionota bacterium]
MERVWEEYLDLQVRLFAAAEIELFGRFGLDQSLSPLLDVGCGTGAYASFLRSKLPNIHLVCVDADKDRLSSLGACLLRDRNIRTKHWSVGVDTPPEDLGALRGAIARYVLQYAPDPNRFLRDLAQVLVPGSPVYIIEEDDGLYHSYPPFEALDRFLEINQAWADLYGSTRQMGRKIPLIVKEAGWDIRHVEVLCHANHNLDALELVRYFELALRIIAHSTPEVVSPEQAAAVAAEMRSYVRQSAGRCFFYYPQVVTIAVTPG